MLPRDVFARRADRLAHAPAGPSFQREWEALAPENELWLRFHPVARPSGPTAVGLLAILPEPGLRARQTEWTRTGDADYANFGELVEVTRRRLCLPPERAAEVRDALIDLGTDPDRPEDLGSSGRDLVTIWWEGSA